jgi:hypothetical protein
MTTRRLVVVLTCIGVAALWPSSARAQDDILGWFGELSGPGPFRPVIGLVVFGGYGHNVFCIPKDKKDLKKAQIACTLDDGMDYSPDQRYGGDAQWMFTVGYTRTRTDREERPTNAPGLFKDDPLDNRDASEGSLAIMAMYRVNRWLDVGSGVQIINFSGDASSTNPTVYPSFSFWRFGLTPALVSVTPLEVFPGLNRYARRLIHLQVEAIWLPQTTSGADFHNPITRFSAGPEFQAGAAALVDVVAAVRLISRK